MFFNKLLNKPIKFQCNICGNFNELNCRDFGREKGFCSACRSTVRMRSIVHLLSLELFKKSLILADFPSCKNLNGLGLTDAPAYAKRLSEKFNYKNTFYHQEPFLDISKELPKELLNTQDFVICSDIFEHVQPPISKAFKNLNNLLKNNGFVIFSVPYKLFGKTKEYFPNLNNYKLIKKQNGETCLKNITPSGEKETFEKLNFHPGAGQNLVFRFFSLNSLIAEFKSNGFFKLKIFNKNCPKFGIIWDNNFWSFPLLSSKMIPKN